MLFFTVCRSYICHCVSKCIMSFCLLNEYWLTDWLTVAWTLLHILHRRCQQCMSSTQHADRIQGEWRDSSSIITITHTYTHLTSLCLGLPRWAGIRKLINLDFTEARDSERQWQQLDHMPVCTSLQTDNYASTPPLSNNNKHICIVP